jgi:hypothetical protein
MGRNRTLLIVCEKYYLRFYRPLAERLASCGFRPVWVMLDGAAQWAHESINPIPVIERLVDTRDVTSAPEQLDALCVFERAVFERPDLFKDNYRYTLTSVRTAERVPRLADLWYQATLALIQRFSPAAVFLWNGRYLPYSAVSAACAAEGQLFLTSEIGWVPGTVFVDAGVLSASTTDLSGRSFDPAPQVPTDAARADAFLLDYTSRKATMVSQTLESAGEVRQRLLGEAGTFLLLYGCQVDWDTNVVIGARRFRSNESAIRFLMQSVVSLPGARIVIKTHPLDTEKNEGRLRDIIGARGTVVSDIHPHTLIEAADCVAVRNSTLGFEALCYRKPLIVLEQAKYTHPELTLDAPDPSAAAERLRIVAAKECCVPNRNVLRQFVLHLLDHYLVPVPYDYHFEPAKLELLSHFSCNDSHRALEWVLTGSVPPSRMRVDGPVSRALGACELRRWPRQSLLRQGVRKLTRWMR